jgi:hypothetical protein
MQTVDEISPRAVDVVCRDAKLAKINRGAKSSTGMIFSLWVLLMSHMIKSFYKSASHVMRYQIP